MISLILNWFHKRAIAEADKTCEAIASAALLARIREDHAAARYFEAELKLANAKRRALLGDPNPGRYCCDGLCHQQGRANCACDSLPRSSTT